MLDLFAGSGQMGIEALSRGAKHCIFVDNARACQMVLRQNLEATGLSHAARIMKTDAYSYLRGHSGPFDLVFLDPPYGQGMTQKALEMLVPVMRESGIIFCETGREELLPEQVGTFLIYRDYHYGKIKITQYRNSINNI